MRVTVTEHNSIKLLPPCLAGNSAWPERAALVMGPKACMDQPMYNVCVGVWVRVYMCVLQFLLIETTVGEQIAYDPIILKSLKILTEQNA